MKAIVILICMMFAATTLSAQTKIGMSSVETSYDMLSDNKFLDLRYSGYTAEVIHTEYLPDSIARVFMSYAFYDDGVNYTITIYKQKDTGSKSLLQKWSLENNRKAGVISFYVRQKEKIDLIFETQIVSDLPSSFSEPFSISTIKREAEVLPSLPITQ